MSFFIRFDACVFFTHAFFNRFHFILTNIRLYFNNVLNLKHFAKALSFKKVFSCMSLFLVLFSSSQDGFSQGTNHKLTFGQKNSASYDILLEGTKTNTYLVNNTKAAIIPPTSCLPSNGYIATTLSEDYPRQYHEKTAKIDDFKIERGSEVVLQSNKLLAAPTNDFCDNSTALTVNPSTTCSTSTSGTTLSATQTTLGCAGYADDDVWYSFVATATSHIVTVTPNTLSDAVFQVYSGTCAAAVSIICVDDTGLASNETTTLTGLTVGSTYLVRVYSYSNGSNQGTFSICVTTPCNYGSITGISGSPVNHLVISQIYGGGGLAALGSIPKAIYKNDFIELFNPTNVPISLNGYSLQYASAGGVNWEKLNLVGTIAGRGYFLIQLFSDTAGFGISLPTPDFSPTSNAIDMANESGKIALINNQNTIAIGLAYPPQASIIDFVGYGVANSAEGNTAALILTRVLANFRNNNGCIDTDINLSDFSVAAPNPRNSASPTNSCTVNTETVCSGIAPSPMTVNGASGSGLFSYQWYSRSGIVAAPVGTSITGWTSLGTSNGANTNIYTPPAAITSSTTYACFVTSSGTPTCGSGAWASGVRQITVTPSSSLGFVNLQFPASGAICSSGSFTAYGRVWLVGVTPGPGAGAGIKVQFGYSSSNSNPSTWNTWFTATYNTDTDFGNNDEYQYTLNSLPAGTYYYAFRYSNSTCNWQYGGYNIGGGGTWNGTNVSGVLTVYGTPTTATAGPDQTVCEGTTITLAANSPTVGIGQWSIISGFGGSVTTPSSPISIFTGTINSTYTLRWTTSNGTCANTSDDVVIRIN